MTSNPNWRLLKLFPTELELTTSPTELQMTTFSKVVYSYMSQFKVSIVWYHLTTLLSHLTRVSNFPLWFSFLQSNLWQDMNVFCLYLVFLCRYDSSPILVTGAHTWTFQFELHFHSKIEAFLAADWKTSDPTHTDNKIINTITHHSN